MLRISCETMNFISVKSMRSQQCNLFSFSKCSFTKRQFKFSNSWLLPSNTFDPTTAVVKWLNSGQRSRQPNLAYWKWPDELISDGGPWDLKDFV